MKILMIGWSLPPSGGGGLDTYCKKIVSELSKSHEVFLTIPYFNMPEGLEGMGNACIIPIQCKEKGTLLDSVLSYNKAISDNLCDERFDIIHTNDWFGTMAASRIKEVNRTAWACVMHSAEYMRRGLFTRIKCDIDFLEDMGIKKSDIIISVSTLMKDSITENFGVKPEKIVAVHNGFSPPENPVNCNFIRNKWGTKNDKIVLYIGRLALQKGIEYLINSAEKVLEEVPDTSFFIGGSGHFEGPLKAFAKMKGFSEKIIFTGRIPDSELFNYYASADVFVSPSIWEPFGITITEAMSMKIPVIATERTGAVEGMQNGVHAAIVKPKSSKEIASAIISLLKDEKKAKAMGNAGYDFCMKNYSWEECAKKTLDAYKMAENALIY